MIEYFVRRALQEDIGRGDLFARISDAVPAKAKILTRSDGVFAGEMYAKALATLENVNMDFQKHDGEKIVAGEVLLTLQSDSHTLLRIERTLLNMLLHASSIASLTRRYVDLLKPYKTVLLDTRKTRPGLREFEKYAVRTGGALNHRMGLDDALMIKDTHLKTIDDIETFLKHARKQIPFTAKIEVEAETIEQAKRYMHYGADIVMCDNMTPHEVKEVVSIRDSEYNAVLLEASGGINLGNIEQYAQSGVDAISTGAIVHQANWLDFSMKAE